jgi:type IV secretion system protein TrbL
MRRSLLIAAALVLASTVVAHAQNVNTIDTIVARFQAVTNGWEAGLQAIAQNTFAILATLQLFWAIAGLAFKRADFSEFVAELVNQIMFIGLFYWLLTTTTTWGPAIISSFRQAGATASGTAVLTPGDVFRVGIDVAGQIWAQISVWAPGASAGLAIAALVVLACFAWIVLTMVTALVESYFVISGGVLLMAFGGSTWTKDVAIGVVRNVFGIGAKLFALQLVTSVGGAFIQQWAAQFNNITAQGVMIEICQALVLAGITKTVPDLFQRMVGGIGTANGGALIGAAAGLASASVMLAGAATKMATAVAGAGALTGAGAALSSAQMAARVAAGTAPATTAGRAAGLIGATARNVGSAVATDVGRRLSGQGSRFGQAGFRQAADLNERQRLLQEQGNSPVPPPRP